MPTPPHTEPPKGPQQRLTSLAQRLRRGELTTLILLVLIFGLMWAFAEIADEVVEEETRPFDRWLIMALRTPGNPEEPLGPLWMESLARDITALGSNGVVAFITLSAVGYLLLFRRFGTAALIIVSVAGGMLLAYGLKSGFGRPRPDLVPHDYHVFTASFPSGHSINSAVTYLTIGALLARLHARRRAKAYFLAVSILITAAVGFTRVYMGVHWPTDVLGGWTLGAAWALMCWLAAHLLKIRGPMDRERIT